MIWRIGCTCLIVGCLASGANLSSVSGRTPAGAFEFASAASTPTLPGEFERQAAVLLSWDEDPVIQDTLIDVVRGVGTELRVLVLVSSPDAQQQAVDALRRARLSTDNVEFLPIPHDTVWIRDYGPATLKTPTGRWRLVDATYGDMEREHDDQVPVALAARWASELVDAPLDLDGGNLLSNGEGLCLTTRKLLDDNEYRQYTEETLRETLRRAYGASHVVFLEPLSGEPTGHVDMFATFVDADTLLLGSYDPQLDAANAEVLDRNAQRLKRVMTSRGPLRVVRIPMPTSDGEHWRTYANVLFANGRVLVPVYPGVDPDGQSRALGVLQRYLPKSNVVPIDCNHLIGQGGAIHCVALNLFRLPE